MRPATELLADILVCWSLLYQWWLSVWVMDAASKLKKPLSASPVSMSMPGSGSEAEGSSFH